MKRLIQQRAKCTQGRTRSLSIKSQVGAAERDFIMGSHLAARKGYEEECYLLQEVHVRS